MARKKDLLIYIKQLEQIIRSNNQLHSVRLNQKSAGEDHVTMELELQLDEKFLIARAKSLASMRFRDKKVSTVRFKDGDIEVKFAPKTGG